MNGNLVVCSVRVCVRVWAEQRETGRERDMDREKGREREREGDRDRETERWEGERKCLTLPLN